MSLDNWVLFIIAVFGLMSTPGPSQLLMLSNSATYGLKNSVATIIGDLSANLLQMIITTAGIGLLIASFDNILIYIKWIGVIYLVWNALKLILSKKQNANNYKKSNGDIWIQFLILSITYISIDGIFLLFYGLAASKIAMMIKSNSSLIINKVGGSLILVAALLLGLKSLDK
jgi:homoserine/homoserine lactone efflux protein